MGTSRTSPGWIPSRALRMVSVRVDMRGHAVFIRTATATRLFDMFLLVSDALIGGDQDVVAEEMAA